MAHYLTKRELENLVGEYVLVDGEVQVVEHVTARWFTLSTGRKVGRDEYFRLHQDFIDFYNRRLEQARIESRSNDEYQRRTRSI